MFEILQYDFIQNALIAGILISIAAGIIGTLVVVNKITFLTGGIAHSAYGGIGIAIFLGIPVLFGATIFAVITAIIIAIITLNFWIQCRFNELFVWKYYRCFKRRYNLYDYFGYFYYSNCCIFL